MNAGKRTINASKDNAMKLHHNTGNQYAKVANPKGSQITFRVDSKIKHDLLVAREDLGFKDFTDFMTHICVEFLKSHNSTS